MINFDNYTNENKTKHNPKWPYILDHPCRILIIRDSASGKTNALLNLITNQPDIDQIIEQTKFSCSPLGKQTNTVEGWGKKILCFKSFKA